MPGKKRMKNSPKMTTNFTSVTITKIKHLFQNPDGKFKPRIVHEVQHRSIDSQGARFGHQAVVQQRQREKLEKNGGKKFAAWAFLTRGGKPDKELERFETFDTEVEAVAHAKYAASRAPKKGTK